MNSKKRTPARKAGSAAILIACVTQLLSMTGSCTAQPVKVKSTSDIRVVPPESVTTTVTSKSTPLAKPVSTTTTTTVVKKRSPHLKRRKGKIARKTSHVKTTTAVRTKSSLSGGVAKTHKHHIVRVQSSEKISGAQQARSNKLNAFLKNPPKMKKTPYFNHPGLDVPSSPAL